MGDQLKTTLKRTRIAQADMELSVVGNEDALRMLEEAEYNNSTYNAKDNNNNQTNGEVKNGDEYSDMGGRGERS